VTLIEDHEFRLLGVTELPRLAAAANLIWHHLPIIDGAAPGSRFERGWRDAGPALHRQLAAGHRIAVHCLAGLGRSGTIAVRLLMEQGMAFDAALDRVRQARPGAVESEEQRAWLECSEP
jgi:protein-tyrosine phosphatase